MAREIVVIEYCDIKDSIHEDQKVRAAYSDVLLVEDKYLTLLQCTEHYERILTLAQWTGEFSTFGWEDNKPESSQPPRSALGFPAMSKSGAFICPECKGPRIGRTGAISHMITQHNYTKVQASHAIPPTGQSLECPECGFLTSLGVGFASHVKVEHGDAVFERLRSAGLTSAPRSERNPCDPFEDEIAKYNLTLDEAAADEENF